MKYDTNQFSGMDPILRRVTIRVRNPENDRYEVLDRSEPCADVGKSRAIALYSDLEQLKNNLEIRWERFLWIKKTRMFINSITITSLSCKSCEWPTPKMIRLIPSSASPSSMTEEMDGIVNDEWISFQSIDNQ